jgi:hypothetical protein
MSMTGFRVPGVPLPSDHGGASMRTLAIQEEHKNKISLLIR